MSSILSLDVGERRIGVAVASSESRLASPLKTLLNEGDIAATIQELLVANQATALVLGLPRNLEGEDTAQTQYVRAFADRIKPIVGVPLYWQDEALTSRKAEEELTARGKPYAKADIDALSATYILEDFLRDNPAEV
ncbi:MAG TPA: Holliday junction resolvase RuvX [Candidatus Saccharimonadales bacterium]|nr:Holliday junction resolvase RuvX [Candidatus Saccharimonadales bacterium]